MLLWHRLCHRDTRPGTLGCVPEAYDIVLRPARRSVRSLLHRHAVAEYNNLSLTKMAIDACCCGTGYVIGAHVQGIPVRYLTIGTVYLGTFKCVPRRFCMLHCDLPAGRTAACSTGMPLPRFASSVCARTTCTEAVLINHDGCWIL